MNVHMQHDGEGPPEHHPHQAQGGDSHRSAEHWIADQNLQVNVFTLYVSSKDAHLILRLTFTSSICGVTDHEILHPGSDNKLQHDAKLSQIEAHGKYLQLVVNTPTTWAGLQMSL